MSGLAHVFNAAMALEGDTGGNSIVRANRASEFDFHDFISSLIFIRESDMSITHES